MGSYAAMTFYFFLRGLFHRAKLAVLRFVEDSVDIGATLTMDERHPIQTAGGHMPHEHEHGKLTGVPQCGTPKDAVSFSFEIEHPFSILCPDCRQATIDLLKRNQQAREQAVSSNS